MGFFDFFSGRMTAQKRDVKFTGNNKLTKKDILEKIN